MTKKPLTPAQLLAEADRLLVLDDKTRATNMDEAVAALKSCFGLSSYRSRSLLAKAARRRRYHLLPDDVRRATPSSAAREFGVSAPNIRRACALGLLKAEHDDTGHWSFTASEFKRWLNHGKHTPGKSPAK